MTFVSSGTRTGMEREGRKGKGKERKKNPKIREKESNERKAFPKFGNGKRQKYPFPYFRNGNQRL